MAEFHPAKLELSFKSAQGKLDYRIFAELVKSNLK